MSDSIDVAHCLLDTLVHASGCRIALLSRMKCYVDIVQASSKQANLS